MKKFLVSMLAALFIFGSVSPSYARVYVRGYTKSNGTVVSPHYRTNPDGVKWNNFSYMRSSKHNY